MDPDDVGQTYGEALDADRQKAIADQMRARAKARKPPPEPVAPPAATTDAKPKPAPSRNMPLMGPMGFMRESASAWRALNGEPEPVWAQVERDIVTSDKIEPIARGVQKAGKALPGAMATLLTGVSSKAQELYFEGSAALGDAVGLDGGAAQNRQWAEGVRRRQVVIDREVQAMTDTINKAVPNIGENETVTEGFIEGVSQFLTVFLATKKLAPKQMGAGPITDAAVRGVAADALGFNPKDPTAANLVEQFFPKLKDSWITATSIDVDDTAAEAQFKRATEGAGLGVAADMVLTNLLRLVRAGGKARAEIADDIGAEQAALRGDADAEAAAEEAIARLGDPSAPDISEDLPARPRTYQDAAPPEVKAARIESAARRAGVLEEERPPELSLEEFERGTGGGPVMSPDDIVEMMDTAKAGIRPRPLLTFVRSEGGIRDDDSFAGELGLIGAVGIKNKNGRTFDAMAERAAEAGYISYDARGGYDVNELLDKLRQDLTAEMSGDLVKRVYSTRDANAASRLPDLIRLERTLDDLGLDWRMRGKNKRRDAARTAASQAAWQGGEPRTLDDLETMQADMDAAGVAGFQPFEADMAGPAPWFDEDGIFDPVKAATSLELGEFYAQLDELSDADAYGAALVHLDLEAKTPEEAREALLRYAIEKQKPARQAGPVVTPEERAFLMDASREDAPASAADVDEDPVAALRRRMQELDEGADDGAADDVMQAEPKWRSPAGQQELAQTAMRMKNPLAFVDQMMQFASEADHRQGIEKVRELVLNGMETRYADDAASAISRASTVMEPQRALTPREVQILEEVTQEGGDVIVGLQLRGVREDAAREIVAHGLAEGRLGPRVAVQAALEYRGVGGVRAEGRRRGQGMGSQPREVKPPTDEELLIAAGSQPDPTGQRKPLSDRQFEIWKMARGGMSNEDIATRLGGEGASLEKETVSATLAAARRKGWEVERAPYIGQDEKTQRLIELRAQGLKTAQIAERLYPGVDPEVAANRIGALASKNKQAILARKAELAAQDGRPEVTPKDIVLGYNDGASQVDLGLDLGMDPDKVDVRVVINAEANRARKAAKRARALGTLDDLAGRWGVTAAEIKTFLDAPPKPPATKGRTEAKMSALADMLEAGGGQADRLSLATLAERLRAQGHRATETSVQTMLSLARSGRMGPYALSPETMGRLQRATTRFADASPEMFAGQPTRDHVATLLDTIRADFGRAGEKLIESGAVIVHRSPETAPFPVFPTTQAGFLRGQVHILADRVSQSQLYGIVLHEAGVHEGLEKMLGPQGWSTLVERLKSMTGLSARGGVPDQAALRAWMDVPDRTKDAAARTGDVRVLEEELVAYYVQNAPRDAGLFKQIMGGIRAWLIRSFPGAAAIVKPTEEALRQLAVRSLRRYARASIDRQRQLGGDNDYIGFYSAVDRAMRDYPKADATPAEIMAHLRAQPGVRPDELADMRLETALGSRRLSIEDARRIVGERRLYLQREISTQRRSKGLVAPGKADDVRDLVFRLPSDVPGGDFSRSGSARKGVIAAVRVSDRKTVDGARVTLVERIEGDVHPPAPSFLGIDQVDPDIARRQATLEARMQAAAQDLNTMWGADPADGGGQIGGKDGARYAAWAEARQALLDDIAEAGDQIGYGARFFGVPQAPAAAPLKRWVQAAVKNAIASAASSQVERIAFPVARMFDDPQAQMFYDETLRAELFRVAEELDLDVGVSQIRMGKLGAVDAPSITFTPHDRARIVETGVPLYADSSRGGGRGGEPPEHMRVRAPGGRTIYINPSRIAADGDIKDVIQRLADRYAGEVNAARGGERQADEDLLASSAAVDAWGVLQARRAGEPLGAKESLAARQLWAASAEWVSSIARRVAQIDNPADRFALNQAIAVHRAIQAEVIGARTETARALRSWAIPMGSTVEKLNQMAGILQTQGVDNIQELAGRLALLGPDQIGRLDEVVEKSLRAKTSDVLGEIFRSALLSNPKTHIVNLLGNTSVIAGDLADTAIAGAVARLLGNADAADMIAEAGAKYEGLMAAFRAQMKFYHENRRFNSLGTATPGGGNIQGMQVDAPRANAISSENFGLSATSFVGKTADVIGGVINKPQELLGGADDFFKGINYQGELYAQAHRIASAEARAGTIGRDAIGARMAELVAAPTETMQSIARKAAQERTFTTPPKPGGVVASVFNIRSWLNSLGLPIGHFIMPFINTPANIMKYTFSRSPAGLLMGEMQAKLRLGGKDAMLARTQMAMGTMGLALGWNMAAGGLLTGGGPVNPRERQTLERGGWQRYSLKIGDAWVSYARLDPLASYLTIGADLHEISANLASGDNDVEQVGEAVAMAIGSIGAAFMSKTYLQGVSDLNSFLAEPARYGERYLTGIVQSMLGPAGIAEIRRQVDPAMRDVSSILDGVKNRWPGASDELAQSRDLWGRPRMYQSHLGMAYDALSPFSARKIDPEPIDAELMRLRYFPQLPGRQITVPVGGRSATVSLRNRPDIYNRLVELSGQRALKMANDLVRSPGYAALQDGSEPLPGTKAFAIETIVQRNRAWGRAMTLQQHWADLQEMGRKELQRELAPAP